MRRSALYELPITEARVGQSGPMPWCLQRRHCFQQPCRACPGLGKSATCSSASMSRHASEQQNVLLT